MLLKRTSLWLLISVFVSFGCSRKPSGPPAAQSRPKLGIRAQTDETIHPDLTKTPAELKKVYDYID
jgi:hypothetical protein